MRRYPGGGAFALFFHPHPREFATQDKKKANARGLDRGGRDGRRWHCLMHIYVQLTWDKFQEKHPPSYCFGGDTDQSHDADVG